jgi:AAA family ATP:ADP antiporter
MLARFGIEMRKGEGAAGFLMFLGFFLIIYFQYTAKTVRDATFIADVGPTFKPIAFLLAAAFSYPCLRLYGYFAKRIRLHVMLMLTCSAAAVSMLAFFFIYQLDSKVVPYAFYVWLSVVAVITVSQYWGYAGTVFDPRQAKRLFGFVGAGGLLGSLAGSKSASIVAERVGTYNVLLLSAVVLGGVILVMYLVHRIAPPDEARVAGVAAGKLAKMDAAKGGFAIIKASRHLTLIMWIMILTVMVANVVDVQFSWVVGEHFAAKDLGEEATRDAIGKFYGNFYFWMSVAAFIFQVLFTARIHRTLGVGVAMRTLPVTMFIGTVGLFFAVSFPAAMLAVAYGLKIGENGFRYSLDQATRELLFLPVPASMRVKAKAYIDVFVQRGAKGLIGFLLLTVTFDLITPVQAGWFSIVLIVVWLFVIYLMSKEYVKSFRLGLKQRSVDEEVSINVNDVTTLELLVESLGSSDSRQVLHGINLLSSHGRGNLVPPLLLYHDEPEIRQRTLEVLHDIGRSDATPLIERRLGDSDPHVRAEAIRVLADLEGQHIIDLMLPKLTEADPEVRAAAVASLANHGDKEHVEQARVVLMELLSDADANARVEAAKALGAIPEPKMQDHLLRMLYDRSPLVVRETILAIRRRIGRDGYNPMYIPTLISLLHHRFLKQDVREALVAFGEDSVPALVHFMGAEDEPLWVRRALPKTIARIGTEQAIEALMASLVNSSDRFLRRKVIEALGNLRDEGLFVEHEEAVAAAIKVEMTHYFDALRRLNTVGFENKGALEGPEIDWSQGNVEPGLLEKLLSERMGEHLRNIFGLFALLHAPRDIWAAYRSMISGQAALRNNALEYLDNTLSAASRHMVGGVLDNRPLEEKLKYADSLLSSKAPAKVAMLEEMLAATDDEREEESGIRVSVMYHVYTEGLTELYPTIGALRGESHDRFVSETATWVIERVGRSEPIR